MDGDYPIVIGSYEEHQVEVVQLEISDWFCKEDEPYSYGVRCTCGEATSRVLCKKGAFREAKLHLKEARG